MYSYDIQRPEGLSDTQWAALVQAALRRLRQLTPVRTGALRDGWFLGDLSASTATFGNEVPYAEYVDAGTSRMAPRNMTGRLESTLGALARF